MPMNNNFCRRKKLFAFNSIVIFWLNGCGFSLKQENINLENFPTFMTSVQADNTSAEILISKLKHLKVQISSFDKDLERTTPWLEIGKESFQSFPITINSSARAAQYELELSLDVKFSLGKNDLIPLERFTVSRDYLENVQNINGSEDEINLILDEMRNDLASGVIRRLEAALRAASLK
jgi:outer membrane lipopolysaccharide assembly protein LptE/RlpB